MEAEWLLEQAMAHPMGDAGRFREALAVAHKAEELANTAEASSDMRRQAAEMVATIGKEEGAAKRDSKLLVALLEVRGPREGPTFHRDDNGFMVALAEPSADEQFKLAFREWDPTFDVDAVLPEEAVSRLKGRPTAVVMEVIAALDEWATDRRQQGMPREKWQPLADLATALEPDADSQRRELREILGRGHLGRERALGMLSMALRPVPVPFDAGLGDDRGRVQHLARAAKPQGEPVLGLLTMARALLLAGDDAGAERLLRAALRSRPQEVVLHYSLGKLLEQRQPPRWPEAVESYAAARALRPDLGEALAWSLVRSDRVDEGLTLYGWLVTQNRGNPWLHFRYGIALQDQGRHQEAVAPYHQAIELAPKFAAPHHGLGLALYTKGDLDGAIAEYHKAIALDPKDARAPCNLGLALVAKPDLDGAIAEYHKAIALDPKEAKAPYNLGLALYAKGDLDGAIAACRQAIELDPKLAPAHGNLGTALYYKGDVDGAIAAHRQAIALDPKHARDHSNLGLVLVAKPDVDGAIAACRQAIALDPKYAPAYSNLGIALHSKGDVDGAIAAHRQAIALDPKDAKSCYNLGIALASRPDLDGAVAAFRQATELDPRDARAHGALGRALLQQGHFAEARTATGRSLELLPERHPLRQLASQQLHQCERLAALDETLPAVLNGEAEPASAAECLALSQLCQQYKQRHAAAARFSAAAFAADPKLAADFRQQHRFNAACSAALAAAGQGEDANNLPDKVRLMLRRQAQGWLRADLAQYTQLAGRDAPAVKQAVRQRLAHWQQDSDLATVREKGSLAQLPDDERQAWRQLWDDVAALLTKVEDKK
jgi:tetratricopeptide (TPR) repeat protein